MEETLRAIATWVSWAAEGLAIVVIAVGILRVAWKYVTRFALRPSPRLGLDLRLDLGRSLALGLELLLAADIIRTAIAPSWDEIGKLAAIAGIRTALNFFLEIEIEREARQLDQRDARDNPESDRTSPDDPNNRDTEASA
jgi:uncharacterized membrane protein